MRSFKKLAAFVAALVYEFFNFTPTAFLILVATSGAFAILKQSWTLGIVVGCVIRLTIAMSSLSHKIVKKDGDTKTQQEDVSYGLATYTAVNTIFDYFIYSYVISNSGLVAGFCIMTGLSLVLDRTLIYIYDQTTRDWLGVEEIKELRGYKGDDLLGRFIASILRKGNIAVMVILTLKSNPFITTIYMREEGGEHKGMTARDWKVFIFSLIVGNMAWSITVFTGWKVLEFILGAQ